ncbi:J domain-containing protein [Arcobacter vandammei]|uniref:J domain-containing protein n=1 Tax=Arcobacter vandammei TaxID=2782243 RepID=UPI0018DF7DEC|nr:DnaJ domain-containing protein [Arcobacter vandammei]
MGQIINLAITILILYLIFTNFGTFLMIIGGIILFFAILIYFVKKSLVKNASKFQYQYQNFDFKEFNQSFNNSGFQGNFYTQSSKIDEAKEFFGFSQTPTKDDIKKRYKELAKIHHPDLNGGDEEKMKKLNEYRDILMQTYGE